MFARRNLLLELRTDLGQRLFQTYVMGFWISGSDEDLTKWTEQLLTSRQLFFPFYPVVEDKHAQSRESKECESDESPRYDYPYLPI